jgi:hypothetical protein
MITHAPIIRLLALCGALLSGQMTFAADAVPAPVPLGDGKITFTPPPADSWDRSPQASKNVAAFTTKARDGVMAVEVLPSDMVIDQNTADAIQRQLRQSRQKAKAKMILQPTVEPDDRFALRIHERYEAVDKNGVGTGKIADQLHLYRYVGQALLMGTVNTLSDDPEVVKTTQATGEDALLSATGPGAKAPPVRKPATKPATKPAKS